MMALEKELALGRGVSTALVSEPIESHGPVRAVAERTAVLALTAAIIFQPILRPTGPGNSSPVDILMVVAIVTGAIWAVSGRQRLRAPYFFPVVSILAAGAASGLMGLLFGLSLLTLFVDLLLFAWCLTVVNVLRTPRAMRHALAAWSWSGICWACVVVLGWLGHVTAIEGLKAASGNRVPFTFGDPNYAAMYWGTTIFVVYAARTPASRWLRIVGYVMLLWALALTESNGGVLALGVGVTSILLVKSYRARGWVGSAATALIIGLLIGAFLALFPLNSIRRWALNSGQPLLVNSIGRSAQSSSERKMLIRETWQLYEGSSGVLGLGPASTKSMLASDFYPYANEAHDDWLASLVELGPLGLLGVALLFASAAYRAAPLVGDRLSKGWAAAVPAPAGLAAGLLALSVNSFYEEILHFRFLWALLGIVAILSGQARSNR